jgi:hypothetical protein
MIGYEVRICAAGSLAQFIVNAWAVQIIRDCGAAAIEIPHHVSAVVDKLRSSTKAPAGSGTVTLLYIN